MRYAVVNDAAKIDSFIFYKIKDFDTAYFIIFAS